jgi:spermidine/putrescine transport system permease protein
LRCSSVTRGLRHHAPRRWQTSLLFLAIPPSDQLPDPHTMDRVLNPVGVINNTSLSGCDLTAPAPLYNRFAVILGLVYNYTPFVILAIYSALQRLDPSYAEASRDLGASAFTTFLKITLPLTAAGVAAGAVFVFVLSIGNFITPDLLGGGKQQMIGNLIYDQFLTARDWPFGATLSGLLIALMMIALFMQAVAAGRARGEHV